MWSQLDGRTAANLPSQAFRYRPIAGTCHIKQGSHMRGKRELTTGERRLTGCGCAMLLALAGFAALGTVETSMCETTTFARSISPSGFTEARVQMTDCGAVSGFTRVVWVQPRWLPSDRWLSCRAVAFDGMEPIALRWTADRLSVASAAPKTSIIATENACYGWKVDLHLQV
jgi:hypothetical protein